MVEATELRLYTEIASDAWLSRQWGEKGRLEYPIGRGLDTDWAEARDSREDELSRLRRLGSSVESIARRGEKWQYVTSKKKKMLKSLNCLGYSSVISKETLEEKRNDTMDMSKSIYLPNSANRDWRAKCKVRRLASLPVFSATSSWPTSHKSNPAHTQKDNSSNLDICQCAIVPVSP